MPGLRDLREVLPLWAKGLLLAVFVLSTCHVVRQEYLTTRFTPVHMAGYALAAVSTILVTACFRPRFPFGLAEVGTFVGIFAVWLAIVCYVRRGARRVSDAGAAEPRRG